MFCNHFGKSQISQNGNGGTPPFPRVRPNRGTPPFPRVRPNQELKRPVAFLFLVCGRGSKFDYMP